MPFSVAETVVETTPDANAEPAKEEGLVLESPTERDEQAASDEAARAVQALMGGLDEDTSQFGFESSTPESLSMPTINNHDNQGKHWKTFEWIVCWNAFICFYVVVKKGLDLLSDANYNALGLIILVLQIVDCETSEVYLL